jgi:hypothetical protein
VSVTLRAHGLRMCQQMCDARRRTYKLIDFGLAESERVTPTTRVDLREIVSVADKRFADDER